MCLHITSALITYGYGLCVIALANFKEDGVLKRNERVSINVLTKETKRSEKEKITVHNRLIPCATPLRHH